MNAVHNLWVQQQPVDDDNTSTMMKRASISRRTDELGSPVAAVPRSRSQERSLENFTDLDSSNQQETLASAPIDPEVSPRASFRRAMSDPFDAGDDEDIDYSPYHHHQNDHKEGEAGDATEIPTTLPRFPVSETRDKNCWSEPPVDIFQVRSSDYLSCKKKYPSEPYLLQARGADLFLSDQPISASDIPASVLGGSLRKVPTLLINFRFPWGSLVQYFEIPSTFLPFLSSPLTASLDELSPPERCLAEWFMGDTEYKNDRLKLIPYVSDGPWIVRNMVTGKPAIIGRKLPVSYRYTPADGTGCAEFLECELDVGNSSATAKRIVSVCRRYMSALTVDIGYVIEGKVDEHLPEQMLGAIRIHGIDPLKAPKLGG